MKAGLRGIVLGLAWLASADALAHKPSDSYLKIVGGQGPLQIAWEIAVKDLDFLLGLDADGNGAITWGELKGQRSAICDLALAHLNLAADGRPCELHVSDVAVNRHSDGVYATLTLETNCPGDVATLTVRYSLLFDVDPTHRGLLSFRNGAVAGTHVLSPSEPQVELKTGEMSLWRSFREYVREGVWHIWLGFDHILFLLSLLLPAVLIRRDGRWSPVEQFRPAGRNVLKVVTMFTLAHSITLWLAVMGYVTLPSRAIESAIAFSIVATGLNNLFPVLPLSSWAIAFGFGLVHGFGFANVLLDLGLAHATLATALLGFNVGVELGQLAIVAAFFPIAYGLRGTAFYRWAVFRAGSAAVIVIAALWMYERACNVKLIGF